MNKKINVLDYTIIIISFLSIIGLILYFANILSPNGEYGTKNYDPYYIYNTNTGIIVIYSFRLMLWISYIYLGIEWIRKKEISRNKGIIILAIISLIAINEWIELWYGSTFYYGEIRDKQGLGLPIFSMFLITYFWLKLKLSYYLKLGLIILTIALHYIIFDTVKEDWALFYEVYIPGTSIPIR